MKTGVEIIQIRTPRHEADDVAGRQQLRVGRPAARAGWFRARRLAPPEPDARLGVHVLSAPSKTARRSSPGCKNLVVDVALAPIGPIVIALDAIRLAVVIADFCEHWARTRPRLRAAAAASTTSQNVTQSKASSRITICSGCAGRSACNPGNACPSDPARDEVDPLGNLRQGLCVFHQTRDARNRRDAPDAANNGTAARSFRRERRASMVEAQ